MPSYSYYVGQQNKTVEIKMCYFIFYSNLKVESRLSCASLSLKQSEKIMFNGLQGKSGLVNSATPAITQSAQSPIPTISSPISRK